MKSKQEELKRLGAEFKNWCSYVSSDRSYTYECMEWEANNSRYLDVKVKVRWWIFSWWKELPLIELGKHGRVRNWE